jgi:tetratricopeptide (TPR) repeat protein
MQAHYDPACGNYEKAIRNGVAAPQLFHNIAYCLSRTGRPDVAAERLEELLQKEPKLFLSHHLCARLQLNRVKSDQAPLPDAVREHIAKALEGIPNEPLLHIDAARTYAYASKKTPNQGDESKVMEHLRKAIAAGVSTRPITTDSLLSSKFPLLSAEDRAILDRVPPTLLTTPLYYGPPLSLSPPLSSGTIAAR